MAGKPGRSGTNRGTEKPFADAVRIACSEVHAGNAAGKKKLRLIAEKLVEMAIDGDMEAIKEISNRIDGRAAQQVAVTGEDGGPIQNEIIIRKLFCPPDADSPAE